MKLVSTKRTAAEKKAEKDRYNSKPSTIGGDEYPYDTRLSLNKNILEKLGISPKDYKVGQKVCVQIEASVKSLRQTEGKDYDTNEIELQIEKIGLEDSPESLKDAVSNGVKDASDE